jgi:hypothetical protein
MDLIVALDKKEYNELLELNQKSTGRLDAALEKLDQTEDGGYWCDLSRIEYALLIIHIKKIQKNHGLCRRLLTLAELQDPDFRNYLDSVERDIARYTMN